MQSHLPPHHFHLQVRKHGNIAFAHIILIQILLPLTRMGYSTKVSPKQAGAGCNLKAALKVVVESVEHLILVSDGALGLGRSLEHCRLLNGWNVVGLTSTGVT